MLNPSGALEGEIDDLGHGRNHYSAANHATFCALFELLRHLAVSMHAAAISVVLVSQCFLEALAPVKEYVHPPPDIEG